MNVAQLSSRAQLLSYLTHAPNLQLLEKIVANHHSEFNQVLGDTPRKALDFGPVMRRSNLDRIVTDVVAPATQFVKDSLQVDDAEECKLTIRHLTLRQTRALMMSGPLAYGVIGFLMASKEELPLFLLGFIPFYVVLRVFPYTKFSFHVIPPAEYNYFADWKTIQAAPHPLCTFVPKIAHEYTHFLQDMKTTLKYEADEAAALLEGQSQVMELKAARYFAAKEDNPAYLYDTFGSIMRSLLSAYIIGSMMSGRAANGTLVNQVIRDCHLKYFAFGFDHHYLKPHDLGTAVVSIAEYLNGPDICQRILKEDLAFLEMP